jgi:hypothetical protein
MSKKASLKTDISRKTNVLLSPTSFKGCCRDSRRLKACPSGHPDGRKISLSDIPPDNNPTVEACSRLSLARLRSHEDRSACAFRATVQRATSRWTTGSTWRTVAAKRARAASGQPQSPWLSSNTRRQIWSRRAIPALSNGHGARPQP